MKKIILLVITLTTFIGCNLKGPNQETQPVEPYDTSYRDSVYLKELQNYRPEISKTQFEKHLSNWDGSLPSLVSFTKENLNNPNSFEHVETGYSIKEDYVKVRMIYRARNSFNALVKGSITAKVDGAGNLLDIIESN